MIEKFKFGHIARALRYRNYRLFFLGQGISLVGTWMQQIALVWLVYRLTKSAFMLGAVGFISQIPAFFLMPLAGVMVDRWSRHRIMIWTQVIAMIQAFILAFLVITGSIMIWHIIVLALFLGLINSFDAPARQAFVFELIEKKDDLGNAIALNSIIFNSARLVGPFMAGILIAAVGEGVCFFINGLSYLAVLLALLDMKIGKNRPHKRDKHVLKDLKDGFDYVMGVGPIKAILSLLVLVSIMGMPYVVLMPIFATQVLKGDARTFGFLMAASGIGALAGAVYLASKKTVRGLCRHIAMASTVFGLALIIFSLSKSIALSLVVIPFVGFGMIVHAASSNTVLQTIVDDNKRGRVMSFYAMSFIGMLPFGSLLAGVLAAKIGAQNTLMIGGISCVLGSAAFARNLPLLRKAIRPIYMKMGIMPEVRSAVEAATELAVPPED